MALCCLDTAGKKNNQTKQEKRVSDKPKPKIVSFHHATRWQLLQEQMHEVHPDCDASLLQGYDKALAPAHAGSRRSQPGAGCRGGRVSFFSFLWRRHDTPTIRERGRTDGLSPAGEPRQQPGRTDVRETLIWVRRGGARGEEAVNLRRRVVCETKADT